MTEKHLLKKLSRESLQKDPPDVALCLKYDGGIPSMVSVRSVDVAG